MSENNTLYLYPQNSCPCSEQCVPPNDNLGLVYSNKMEDMKKMNKNTPTTPCSGVLCNMPEMFKHCQQREVYSRAPYGAVYKQGINLINPEVDKDKYAKDFGKVMNPVRSGLPAITYRTNDPRTFNSPHAQHLSFDRPPITGQVKLNEIYDEKFRDYGNIRGGYETINDGQILYYVEKEREDAYFRPLFSSPASVTTMLYKDPMSGVTPAYNRGFPQWKNPTLDQRNDCGHFCASFVRDEDFHRQELFSDYEAYLQQRVVARKR